ncbi:MAG: hypothetical protein IPL65_13950 [Lewinellaceae bacterium]|nr:hypothetical protein [Lewinellaceae bacterium]
MVKKAPISQSILLEALLPLSEQFGRRYRKCRNIFAKRAAGGEKIATITQDGLETENTAAKGDYIIRNQTKASEQYILPPAKFNSKYLLLDTPTPSEWQEYRPNGEILGFELTEVLLRKLDLPAEFTLMASWGQSMKACAGDFLAVPSGQQEVYRIARQEFFETYIAI